MKGCSPSAMRRHTTTVCSSHQQQTASARPSSPGFGSTVRRFVTPFAEPPSIPRSTAAPITPTSYKTSHISTSSSRLRRSGSGGGRSRPDSSAVKALQSSQSTSSSHSGLSGSPQTDFEYDSDNYAMNNTSSHSVHHHQARAALTPEDLRIR